MDNKETIGDRVRQLCKALNLTQEQFGVKLGYWHTGNAASKGMSKLVNNDLQNLDVLSRIATVYGVSLDWLILGRGSMNISKETSAPDAPKASKLPDACEPVTVESFVRNLVYGASLIHAQIFFHCPRWRHTGGMGGYTREENCYIGIPLHCIETFGGPQATYYTKYCEFSGAFEELARSLQTILNAEYEAEEKEFAQKFGDDMHASPFAKYGDDARKDILQEFNDAPHSAQWVEFSAPIDENGRPKDDEWTEERHPQSYEMHFPADTDKE